MKRKTNGLSLYWKCQLIGWSIASLYWALMGITGTAFSLPMAVILFVGDLLIYIIPTHFFKLLSLKNKWEQKQPKQLLFIILPSILIIGFIFMVLTIGKNFVIKYYLCPSCNEIFSRYFNSSWLITWMTGIRLASIWILAYYLYHYAQAELKATKESNRLSLIAKNAQLENLTAQLNPHFFFNSLNNIKALISENPEQAKRAIDLLSELLRTSLYHRHTELITLAQELSLVNDYLELQKMRFEERLHISLAMESVSLAIKILPLSLQTLVENAVKHGISKTTKGGTISISAKQEKTSLTLVVQNPGQLSEIESNGLGLKNLRERLALQYNGKAIFSIENSDENTVLCRLILPI